MFEPPGLAPPDVDPPPPPPLLAAPVVVAGAEPVVVAGAEPVVVAGTLELVEVEDLLDDVLEEVPATVAAAALGTVNAGAALVSAVAALPPQAARPTARALPATSAAAS